MADLAAMRAFNGAEGPNLTGMLRHDAHVVPLAESWRPLIRFHEDERFHPVGLDGLELLPRPVYVAANRNAQQALEVSVEVAAPDGSTVTRRFPPPVLHVPDPGGNGRLVLNELDASLAPFARGEVGADAVLTHGDAFRRSNALFGSLLTVSGLPDPVPGDPRAPRHPIRVIAELRMMREALSLYLAIDNAPNSEYPMPDDSLWDVVRVVDMFFEEVDDPDVEPAAFPDSAQKDALREILAERAPAIPEGWRVRTDVVETALNAAILNYDFIYAQNDYDQYEPWPANHHEGDDEGCCLIFDRRELEKPVQGGDDGGVLRVAPLFIVTSVHLERQRADRIKDFDVFGANEVFVARSSHATYLTPGSHDFMSFGASFDEGVNVIPDWLAWLSLDGVPLLAGLVAGIAEHFRDSNDETSTDGIAAGREDQVPGDVVDPDRLVPIETVVTPLSADRNVYAASSPPTPAEDQTLGLLSYAGQLGATDAKLGSVSPVFGRKPRRFFRKLITSGRRIT